MTVSPLLVIKLNENVSIHGYIMFFIWCIYTPFIVLTLFLFYRRRKVHPIKARGWTLLILSTLAGFLMVTGACFEEFVTPAQWPCGINLWLTFIAYPVYFLSYSCRAARLLFIFRRSQTKAKYADNTRLTKTNRYTHEMRRSIQDLPDNSSDPLLDIHPSVQITETGSGSGFRTFLTKLRRLVFGNTKVYQEQFMVRVLALVVTISACIALYRQIAVPENSQVGQDLSCSNPPCTCQSTQYYINSSILFALFLIIMIASIYRLRGVKDEFSINSELQSVCFVWLVTIVPFLIMNLSPAIHTVSAPTTYFMVGWVIFSNLSSILWPLYRSYFEKPITFANSQVLSSLKAILHNAEAKAEFEKFLIGEFSVENIAFWQAAQDFRVNTSPDTIKEDAMNIFHQFIEQDSFLEVNIDGVIREKIRSCLPDPDIHIFSDAQNAIFRLMESDSYPRFMKSTFCKNLSKNLQHDAELYSKLQN